MICLNLKFIGAKIVHFLALDQPWALSKLLENHKIADIGSTEFKLFIKESPP